MTKIKVTHGLGTGKNTTMVYKHPGKYDLGKGDKYDYKVVDTKNVEKALEEGWYLHPAEAKKNSTAPAPKPVVNTLEESKKLAKQQEQLLEAQKKFEIEKDEFEKEKKRLEFEKKNKQGAKKAG